MSTIINASIQLIDHNPFRMVEQYPFNERKIQALMHSITEVGLWEGVIARKTGRRYQLAFGHHRIEAVEQLGLKKALLIVRDLDDKQMLQFMGRENLEDYNADFLVMLNTWEAALKFLGHDPEKLQPLDIASLLGWTDIQSHGYESMNDTAKACNSAYQLIAAGHNKHADFEGLTVRDVRALATRALSRIEALERRAAEGKRPHEEVKTAQKIVAKAAKSTADSARKGDLLKREIANEVDARTWIFAQASKRKSPIFAQFADTICRNLEKMLETDATAQKLHAIVEQLPTIVEDEDFQAVSNVRFRLNQLKQRTGSWMKKIETAARSAPAKPGVVVKHPALTKGA